MSMIPDQYLLNIPQLRGLNFSLLRELAKLAKPASYYPGQHIITQGDLGNRLFIIVSGQVNLRQADEAGVERSLAVLPAPNPENPDAPCNYFGEQMLSTQEPFAYTAHAVNDCEVYVIERKDFDEFSHAHPEVQAAMPFIQEEENKRTQGYQWVDTGEVIAAVIHKHWWALLPGIVRVAFFALLALAVGWGFAFLGLSAPWWLPIPFWILPLALAGWEVYDWHNDEYIITTRRVAHVERVLLTQELRESIPIEKIQGVTIQKKGLTAWMGIGRLSIQSAGREEGSVVFEVVGNPEQVRKIIAAQQVRDRARLAAEEREQNRARIEEELRNFILPQTLPHEQAAPPVPPPRPDFWRWLVLTLNRWVYASLSKEVRQGSMIIWRKHWIVLLQQMKRWLIALIVLNVVLVIYWLVPGIQVLPPGVHLLVGLVLLLICLGGLVWEWIDWSNDIYAITDTQIIDSEKLPFGLRETTITAPLDQVQDVRVEVPGFWNFIFDFGNVKIETAGKTAQMNFHSVRSPREVADTIFKRQSEYRARRAEMENTIRNRGFVDALVSYHRLVKEEERIIKEQGTTPASSTPPPTDTLPAAPPSSADAPKIPPSA